MAKNGTSIGEIRKKVTKTYDTIGTAYHEAGHTVFGLLHCMKISSVYIFEHKNTKRIHGYTYNTVPWLESIEDRALFDILLQNEIGFSYSGFLAEKHHFKTVSGQDQVPMFIKSGSYVDNQSIAQLVKQFNPAPPGNKRAAYKKRIIRRTTRCLQQYWDDVSLVAHQLFQRKRLSYLQLQEILLTDSANKKFWRDRFKAIDQIYELEPINEVLLLHRLTADI